MSKRDQILQSALMLFASKGVDASSTSRIAKEAGVSEGLIFRHFKNKEGLLEAILEEGRRKSEKLYEKALDTKEPKELIRNIIRIPFSVKTEDLGFWKLLYQLKWNADRYDKSMSEPIRIALLNAFRSLKVKDPEAETEYILSLMDGIATTLLLKTDVDREKLLKTILNKI